MFGQLKLASVYEKKKVGGSEASHNIAFSFRRICHENTFCVVLLFFLVILKGLPGIMVSLI